MISDGLHPHLHRLEYERLERVNISTLKQFSKSAAHYHSVLTTPTEDTDPKRLGRATHMSVFEPERFQSSVAKWTGKVRRGGEWDRFCEANDGKELLTADAYEQCLTIQRAVRGNKNALPYVTGGRGEVALLWTHVIGEGANRYSFEAKGRLDFDGRTALSDLKTTRDASERGFARQVVALNYDAQFAFYSDGYERATGRRKPFVCVAVENFAPYAVAVYRIPESVLAVGRAKYESWLAQLGWCREHNEWPAYFDGERDLELPSWALPAIGDDLADLGLDIGDAA